MGAGSAFLTHPGWFFGGTSTSLAVLILPSPTLSHAMDRCSVDLRRTFHIICLLHGWICVQTFKDGRIRDKTKGHMQT